MRKQAPRTAILFAISALLVCGPALAQPVEWTPINTDLWGGPVGKIVGDSDGDVYALSRGRLYALQADRASWTVLDAEEGIADVLVSPDDKIIAAMDRQRLLRSDDGARSWSSVRLPVSSANLALHPSGDLFAANGPFDPVWRSSDFGDTWLPASDSLGWITDIQIAPSGVILVSTLESGVYRSDDLGETWTNVGFSSRRIEFVASGSDGSLFISSFSDDSSHPECFQHSADGGVTWQGVSCSYRDPDDTERSVSAVSVRDEGAWIVADGSMGYLSDDEGETWEAVTTLWGEALGEFAFVDGRTFVPTSVGVAAAGNDGETWERIDRGIESVGIASLELHPDGYMLAGTATRGLQRLRDGEWERVHLGRQHNRPVTDVAVSPLGVLFAADGEVYHSDDDGLTWDKLTGGFGEPACRGDNFVLSPEEDLYLGDSGGSGGLFRYDPDERVCEHVAEQFAAIQDIDVANDGDLLVATGLTSSWSGGGLFRSPDAGETWEDVDLPSQGQKDTGQILVNPDGLILAGAIRTGVYRSTDDGRTFEFIFPEPAFGYISEFAVAQNGDVYAGSSGYLTVARSTDGGSTWESVNNGLPESRYLAVAFDEAGHLYAGSDSWGVYRTVVPVGLGRGEEVVSRQAPSLEPNYPNPFSDATTFEFRIDQAQHVRLSVYDLMGREIAVLADRAFTPGAHSIAWSADHLSSGAYFCRLRAGAHTAVRRFVVVR